MSDAGFDLTGRTALITGSSAGIGLGLARGLEGVERLGLVARVMRRRQVVFAVALQDAALPHHRIDVPLHRRIVDDPQFQAGDYTIHWLEDFVARGA